MSVTMDPIFLKRPGTASANNKIPSKADNDMKPTTQRTLEDMVYSKDLQFEIREFHDTSARQEILNIRIFRLGEEREPDGFRLEIVQADDLFFHYQTSVQASTYRALQNKQNLTVEFHQFLDICTKILEDCANHSETYSPIFKFKSDGQAKVAFFQNLGYKYIELLALEFQASTDQEIKEHVKRTYRSEHQQTKARLTEVLNIVKAKNPSLLLYLQQSNNYETSSKAGKGGIRFQ